MGSGADVKPEEHSESASTGLLCGWMPDEEGSDYYETDCNNSFMINEGSPSDNAMKFCCFCGNRIKEEEPEKYDYFEEEGHMDNCYVHDTDMGSK